MFKLSGTSILKSSMLLVKNDDLLYQIEIDFAVCLDLVYGCLVYILFIIFSVKSAVLMDCIKGISISTDIYIHVCIFQLNFQNVFYLSFDILLHCIFR